MPSKKLANKNQKIWPIIFLSSAIIGVALLYQLISSFTLSNPPQARANTLLDGSDNYIVGQFNVDGYVGRQPYVINSSGTSNKPVEVPDKADWGSNLTNQMSAEFWFKAGQVYGSGGSNSRIYLFSKSEPSKGYNISYYNKHFYANYYGVAGSLIYTQFSYPTITITDWHQLVVTKTSGTGGKISLYLDGLLVDDEPSADLIIPSVDALTIGGYSPIPSIYRFNGSIDEIKIYNKALDTNQIKNNYDRGKLTIGLVPKELIVPFSCDASNATITDNCQNLYTNSTQVWNAPTNYPNAKVIYNFTDNDTHNTPVTIGQIVLQDLSDPTRNVLKGDITFHHFSSPNKSISFLRLDPLGSYYAIPITPPQSDVKSIEVKLYFENTVSGNPSGGLKKLLVYPDQTIRLQTRMRSDDLVDIINRGNIWGWSRSDGCPSWITGSGCNSNQYYGWVWMNCGNKTDEVAKQSSDSRLADPAYTGQCPTGEGGKAKVMICPLDDGTNITKNPLLSVYKDFYSSTAIDAAIKSKLTPCLGKAQGEVTGFAWGGGAVGN